MSLCQTRLSKVIIKFLHMYTDWNVCVWFNLRRYGETYLQEGVKVKLYLVFDSFRIGEQIWTHFYSPPPPYKACTHIIVCLLCHQSCFLHPTRPPPSDWPLYKYRETKINIAQLSTCHRQNWEFRVIYTLGKKTSATVSTNNYGLGALKIPVFVWLLKVSNFLLAYYQMGSHLDIPKPPP